MRFKNIEFLIDGEGEISIGRFGSTCCAAVACDQDSQLAALVRRKGESLLDLVQRLDAAIEKAWNEDVYIDEING